MANITPLIKKFKKSTFITFQSASEDFTFTSDNPTRKMRFSNFALLDIPPIQQQTGFKNNIQFNTVEGAFSAGLSQASPTPENTKYDLSESLQNYLLNIETLLISKDTYNSNLDQTVAERVFFKWLKELGAIRFRDTAGEKSSVIATEPRWVEHSDNSTTAKGDLYSRVVRYIGTIDAEGVHRTNNNSYREIYIYVPTEAGYTPHVMFKTTSDENYYPSMVIHRSIVSNIEYIAGRNESQNPSAAGLRTLAFYDQDADFGTYTYDINDGTGTIWFEPLAQNVNSYFTDSVFTDSSTDKITRTYQSKSVTWKRNRLDGIGLDFDIENYKWFSQNPSATSINEFNLSSLSDSFKFNAVAIYYDVYDPTNTNPDGSYIVLAKNLFGVLFLNDVSLIGGSPQIQEISKIKPNKISGDQGNAYGIKLNLKFDISSDTVDGWDYQIDVDPFNTQAMETFMGAMTFMQMVGRKYDDLLTKTNVLLSNYETLSNVLLSNEDKSDILKQLNDLTETVSLIGSTEGVTSLISKLSDKVDSILKGNTTIGLDFFFDLIPSDGLGMKIENKQLYFTNKRQQYPYFSEVNIDVSEVNKKNKKNTIKLEDNTTLIYHRNNGESKIASANVHIYINDYKGWQNGQTLKISIDHPINFNGFGVIIYTDSKNSLQNNEAYSKIVTVIEPKYIINDKPVIEITCINNKTLDFVSNIK